MVEVPVKFTGGSPTMVVRHVRKPGIYFSTSLASFVFLAGVNPNSQFHTARFLHDSRADPVSPPDHTGEAPIGVSV